MSNWWKDGIIYQIYPKSFQDSNGDGIGDIPGIISRLDYLDYLGIDMLWISPIYESPDADNGYDISDYYKIRPEFGTEEDFEELLKEMHRRDIRLILDMVVNHTSDEHDWFQKSRKDPAGPYGDFYHWHSGKEGELPSNWGSFFGGPAWSWDQLRQEYYLHLFHEKQPDLNWENNQVRQEIYKMMRYWLDRGVDGFRLDVINLLAKADGYPDGKVYQGQKYGDGVPYFTNGDRLEKYLAEMNDQVFRHYDMVTIGETIATDASQAKTFISSENHPLDMLIHFEHMSVDHGDSKWDKAEFDLVDFKNIIDDWDQEIRPEGWNAFYLNNHDQPRAVSRFGDVGNYHYQSATMLATMLLTLPATPFIYQGEELGMTNYEFTDFGELRDVESTNYYKSKIEIEAENKIFKRISEIGRDNSRTPVQWSQEDNAGFTDDKPWIKINPNYKTINVKHQRDDKGSILSYYREMIEFRKSNQALISGSFEQIAADDEEIFAYWRRLEEDSYLILLNFSDKEQSFLADSFCSILTYIQGNYFAQAEHPDNSLPNLKPYEARIYKQSY